MKKHAFFILGSAVSSILFGTLHFKRYATLYPVVYLIIMGGFCSYMRFKWGLLPAIILHGVNNALASMLGIVLVIL